MNIHLAYYRNIGPFADQEILLHFPDGKYMIQSPVGTGKSFLFFDGLVYGLYKYCDRNIVNAKCKDADIYIVFSVENDLYMIHRNITATNTKTANSSKVSESTKSKLYKYKSVGTSLASSEIAEKDRLCEEGNDEAIQEITKSSKSENSSDIYNFLQNINKNLPNQIVTKAKGFDQYININDRSPIDFKNETDLNNHLKEFLPLREVFTNRNIFMQGSEDIFAVQEAERLKIFKNIFGLLDIDRIKDELTGRAREIKGTIAAKKNNDTHNTNFNKYITQLHNIYTSLSDPKPQSITRRITENQMFIEKMTIDGLDISELAIDDEIYTHISSAKAKYQDIYTRHQILESQISTNKSDSSHIQTQINNNLQNMDILTSKVSAIDPKYLESLKSEKISLINQRQESQTTILNSSQVLSIGLGDILGYDSGKNIGRNDLMIYINDQIQKGKDLRLDLSNTENTKQSLNSSYQNLNLQLKSLIDSQKQALDHSIQLAKSQIQNQIANLKNQQQHIDSLLTHKQIEKQTIQTKLDQLQNDLNSQSKFHCAKIAADCPFISQINDSVIARTLILVNSTKAELEQNNIYISEQEKAKQSLSAQINDLENKLFTNNFMSYDESEDLKSKYTLDINNLEAQISALDFTNQDTILSTKITEINSSITQIINNLNTINYKDILEKNLYIGSLDQKITGLDNQISKLESELANIGDIHKQIDHKKSENQIHETKLKELSDIYIGLENNLKSMSSELANCDIQSITKYENSINELASTIDKIKYIYEQFANDAKALKLLEDEEKIVKNLTNIFGKELMLLVLQEFLPALEDEINSLLNRIVDYEVRFVVLENGDKMEINIKQGSIYREVKSLSGGQKAILRLCWIFAIARRSHNEFLFLDETINNLDADNISAVADMIEDFTKQNQMKFYSITHSAQIQNMSIRDQVINVKEYIS